MKDFYDLHRLASSLAFDAVSLGRAIRATFDRRRTPLPATEPLALAQGFLTAPERQTQWRAFLRRARLKAPQDAGKLAEELRAFLSPVLMAAARGEKYERHWPPGGPWLAKAADDPPSSPSRR